MVFFALTRTGYDEIVSLLGRVPSPLWVNIDVLSPIELSKLHQQGIEITNFTRFINPAESSAVQAAISTISEHHSGQNIWVEHAPDL